MAQIKPAIFSFILFCCVLASGYFFYQIIFAKEISYSYHGNNPDVIIENLTSLSFDKQGQPSAYLITPLMQYNSYYKRTLISKPVITLYQKNEAPWTITADSGTATQKPTLYTLIGNVLLNQGKSSNAKITQITTSRLNIFPDQHLAKTDKKIKFLQIGNDNSKITVTAIGAIANQKTGEVKLLSQAKGDYNAK